MAEWRHKVEISIEQQNNGPIKCQLAHLLLKEGIARITQIVAHFFVKRISHEFGDAATLGSNEGNGAFLFVEFEKTIF